jgi:hypothetical protein
MTVPQRHVVFIPGKNPKPAPVIHRELIWRCIAAAALESASAVECKALQKNFHLAAWNRLYYLRDADIAADLPWVERLLQNRPEDASPPDVRSRLHTLRIRLLYTLGDLMPVLTQLAGDAEIRATLAETRRYFRNTDGISDRIRGVIKNAIRPLLESGHDVLLVGHSLGSVIAFDTLWEVSRREPWPWRVNLLTLGSPLGLHYVQRRLLSRRQRGALRYPDNIRHWINVATTGDLTAVDRRLHNDFRAMLKLGLVDDIEDYTRGVYSRFRTANGPNPHRCYGYFFNPMVARIITGWLQDGSFAAQPSLLAGGR